MSVVESQSKANSAGEFHSTHPVSWRMCWLWGVPGSEGKVAPSVFQAGMLMAAVT